MADVVRIGSGVSRVPLRRADDVVERIEAMKIEASARGFGTLAYFLDTALIEAKLQEQHIIDDTAIARGNWPPVRKWKWMACCGCSTRRQTATI